MKIRLINVLLYLLPCIIVLSNIEIFTDNTLRKGLLYVLYGVLLIYNLIRSSTLISSKFISIFVLTIITMFYMLFVKGVPFSEDFVIYLVMDVGMLLIGASIATFDNKKVFENLLRYYILVSTFSCIYYNGNYDVTDVYAFLLKHCMAANVLIAFWIIVTHKSIFPRIVWWVVLIIHIYALLHLNSRSTFVSLMVGGVFYLYYSSKYIFLKKKEFKRIFIPLAIIAIILSPYIIDVISSVLRLDVLVESDLDSYSADRIPMIIQGLSLYTPENYLLGVYGNSIVPKEFYVECFPIEIVVKYGIIGGGLYFSWIYIISKELFCQPKDAILGRICIISLLAISLFTQHAPVGPGTAYSFAWLIIGFYSNYLKKHKKKVYVKAAI